MSDDKKSDKPEVKAEAPAATPAPAAKSKSGLPTILIIVVVVCIICGILAVGGYFVATNLLNQAGKTVTNLAENALNQASNGYINGTSNVSNSTDNGSGSVSLGGSLPSGFPSDVPIYPNSSVGFSTSDTQNGQKTFTVTLSTKAATADVINFYKDKLGQNGWSVTSEQNFFGSSITAEKDTRQVTVVALGDDKTNDMTITIDIGPK